MKKTIIFSCSLLLLLCTSWNSPDNTWRDKVDPTLLEKAEQGHLVEALVQMKEKANLSPAYALKSKKEKGQYVFNQLLAVAKRSQAEVIQLLEAGNAQYHPFYIVNAIYVKVELPLLRQIAERTEVQLIAPNPWVKMEEPTRSTNTNGALEMRDGIEWGIERINADDVWNLGYTGQNVVVGGQDTGYEWEHPAIKDKYRGWDGSVADHNYNWHDAIHEISPLHNDSMPDPSNNPCGLDVPVPCDDHNHGTHTMGTMVGDDGEGNQIGVAPGARWMACRNMERGYGSPATYTECFQWFLAPTDLNNANPDPSKAPHVINNSWSCPELEGCNESNWAMMEEVVNNLKAAGVVVVVSAGNSGSSCETVSTPAAMFQNSFSIGAIRSNDTIAGFSSRGPVAVDGSFRLKPNVVAPGVGVRSSIRNGNYASFNGTSMAGPHVAGAVALIISARPELAGQVEVIESLLEETAISKTTDQECGGLSGMEVPNHTYGYGRIDVFEAVEAALEIVDVSSVPEDQPMVDVFPNPFTDQLQFQFKQLQGKTTLEIFNASGQLLQQHAWNLDHDMHTTISLKHLPADIYIYRITNDQHVIGGKLVKN